VDGAVLSTSKFLSGGAGSIGGMYLNPRHKDARSGIRGWFGTDRNLLGAQRPVYTPSQEGLKRFQISGYDPMRLAMAEASLSYFVEAGMNNVTLKTQKLARYLMQLL
jgi:kynureninase